MQIDIIVRVDNKEHIIASASLQSNLVPHDLIGTLLPVAGDEVKNEVLKFMQ